MRGLEPPASRTTTERSNQTELHPPRHAEDPARARSVCSGGQGVKACSCSRTRSDPDPLDSRADPGLIHRLAQRLDTFAVHAEVLSPQPRRSSNLGRIAIGLQLQIIDEPHPPAG